MKNKIRKAAVSLAAVFLLLLLYMVIFSFSAQDGEQSGSLSRIVSEKCAEVLGNLSRGKLSQAVLKSMADYFEHPIRKLAHFSEYACMGILVFILWSQWMRQGKRLKLLTVGWVFVSAAGDEFHQLFVPGRYGSFADVVLDTCGGAFGMLLCLFVLRIWRDFFETISVSVRKFGKF